MVDKIDYVNALNDNYIWLLIKGDHVIAIDPGEASPLLNWLSNSHYQLKGIVITHHHYDHVGGIDELIHHFPKIKIAGPEHQDIQPLHIHAKDKITIDFWNSNVIHVPGHTKEHVAYYDGNQLFCGDTLFCAGCGRNFECEYDVLFDSLQTLKKLPDTTKIYCGHEYTISNLKFAQMIEPLNPVIESHLKQCETLQCTLPSTIALEKKINPFLRCSEASIISAIERRFNCKAPSEKQVFKLLRKWKDTF
jgi:hydroxyacylglutathione hydrolase